MQLVLNPNKRLLTRMFTTSLGIITFVGLLLAYFVTELNTVSRYNQFTSDLIAKLPVMAADYRENNLVPITQAQDNDNIETDFIMATCDHLLNSLWQSNLASDNALNKICETYRIASSQSDAPILHFSATTDADTHEAIPERHYLVLKLDTKVDDKDFSLLILKDAKAFLSEQKRFSRLTYIRLLFILLAASALLASAAYWSMAPLRKLKIELQKLKQGSQKQLTYSYPIELEEITESLNQLLSQNQQRQSQYQNAMNDLAHSLKTRLAASVALIDDNTLNDVDKHAKILAQIDDMDQLVKYQLKRAMIGRQGLLKELTLVKPVMTQLGDMLSKVYQHKQVNLSISCPDDLSVPMTKGDVMELCGNLMENAFKFCISTVEIKIERFKSGEIILSVDDDGPGIPEELREKVLHRGARADTKQQGQGIGLAVCDELVHSYQGRLQITTSHLQGACFTITLPAVKHS